jgi:hypothetical protein
MVRHVAGHQRGTDFARIKGANLLVDGANLCPLVVGQGGQIDRTGHVVFREFGRAAHVDNCIEPVRHQISQTVKALRHGVSAPDAGVFAPHRTE